MFRNPFQKFTALVTALVLMMMPNLNAQDRSPDLSVTVPGGSWTTDRYAPELFQLSVVPVHGRNDVLNIHIGNDGNAANRPGGQQGTFYNTQGKSIIVDPTGTPAPVSQFFEFDLWVDQSWADNTNGFVRTDMWGRVSGENTPDNDESGANYPILGFTNYGGYTGFRYWDSSIGWINLVAAAVDYNDWNTLRLALNGDDISAWINGVQYYTQVNSGVDRLSDIFLQGYNFNDPTLLKEMNNPEYDVYWANTAPQEVVPEPATMSLIALGLAGMGAAKRRRKK